MDNTLKNIIETTDFQGLFERKGYAFFTKGSWNLNIIGLRDLREGRVQRDKFNDACICIYRDEKGSWVKKIWEITTDPGLKMLQAPMTSKGTAILVPGQYRGAWQIGYHKSDKDHEALVQRKPVKVFRDNNKDNKLDFDPKTIEEGLFGINLHRNSKIKDVDIVGAYSAGCQVWHYLKDFKEFISLCKKSRDLYGNSFSYTLLTTDFD